MDAHTDIEAPLPLDADVLKRLARYMGISSRQHHVTVHSNGRCLLLRRTVRYFRLSGFSRVTVSMEGDSALLHFHNHEGGNRIVFPCVSGRSGCLYFYSRHISRRLKASTVRLRFIECRFQPDGTCFIRLALTPVRDLYAIINQNS